MHLTRIGYVSALEEPWGRAALDAHLSDWRRRNAQRGITGFLLHHAGSVFQVLEGFPEVVRGLYDAIARDRRHHFLARLIDEPIAAREFGDWSMGYGRVTGTDLGSLPGLRAFLDPAFRYWHCNEDMAGALVRAFAAGPWRRAIG